MEDLRRMGGEAGVVAGLALGWLFLGMMVVFPAAGLSFSDQLNPHKFLIFVARHEYMFWTVNVLGGLLAAAMSIILYLAVGDRFSNEAPATARIGALFGVLGAFGFAAAALLRQYGMAPLTHMYVSNQIGAVHAFRGMSGALNAATALGEFFTGLAALAFAGAMLAEKAYRNAGMVAIVTGATMVLATFISHVALAVASSLAAAVWFVWTALMLRAEAGPAFFKWQYVGSKEARSQRRAA